MEEELVVVSSRDTAQGIGRPSEQKGYLLLPPPAKCHHHARHRKRPTTHAMAAELDYDLILEDEFDAL